VTSFRLRRLVVAAVALVLLTLGLSGSATAISTGIVVSQVYGGGGNAGATFTHDFMELFNRGNQSVDVSGWSVQYAATQGTNWNRTNLSGSIPPGGYYLVQQSQGTGGTTPLPTPDATGTTAMAAGAGKVVLVNNQTTIAAGTVCPTSGVVDLVGYGTGTNCFEGAAPTALLSNTTAALRGASGCTETDSNSSDFAAGAPNPRNTSSPLNPCVGDGAPAVTSTSPVNGATDVVAATDVTIGFNEPVTVTGSWFSISCTTSGAHGAAVTGGPSSFVLNPATDFTPGETCTVTVVAAQVADQDTTDPPDNMTADFSFSFEVGNPCAAPFTTIPQIQGSGATAAITGNVTTQGVVVGDFEGPLTSGIQGFFLQDATGDGNAATSDGIFVFTGDPLVNVSPGQVVRVTGFARERFNQTALNGTNSNTSPVPASNIVPCGTGSVTPTQVNLPAPAPTNQATALEQYEGMLVRLPQALVISEYFNYDRFGEIVLGLPLPGTSRHFTPTSIVEPGAPHVDLLTQYQMRRLTLDDGLGSQNPEFTRHPNGMGFSLSNSFRGGDTVASTLGVMSWDFNLWRIQPTGPAVYAKANLRPGPLESVDGVRVATMNTLNFFLTLDVEPNAPSGQPPFPGDNACGPLRNVECRGADTNQPEELNRQRTKLLHALSGLEADVIGLNELENTAGVDPLSDPNGIVPGLNAMLGAGTYDAIDTGTIGGDAIKVGLIYKPGVVRPLGDFKLLTSAVDPRFIDTLSRPVLAQTFEVIATGARFTVAVNHLKSKNASPACDADNGDGQGNCNLIRKAAAEALVDWLATDPTGSDDPDFLIMGDLNAYAKEDPIDAITKGPDDTLGTADDYTNLVQRFDGQFAYSFVFDGMAGYLDHGLASSAVLDQVLDAAEWHINADEPDLVDYDTSFKSATQDTFFESNQFRSADHDPLVLTLCGDLTACATDRLRDVQEALEDLLPGASKKARDKLEDVLDKVEKALQRLERSRPNRPAAAGDVEGAAGDLQAAIKEGAIGATAGKTLLEEMARAVRLLAVDAIEEAKASGGKADKIDDAERELARGDVRLAAGRYKDAIAEYKDALSKAEGA
jgi:uncharacterized protein